NQIVSGFQNSSNIANIYLNFQAAYTGSPTAKAAIDAWSLAITTNQPNAKLYITSDSTPNMGSGAFGQATGITASFSPTDNINGDDPPIFQIGDYIIVYDLRESYYFSSRSGTLI